MRKKEILLWLACFCFFAGAGELRGAGCITKAQLSMLADDDVSAWVNGTQVVNKAILGSGPTTVDISSALGNSGNLVFQVDNSGHPSTMLWYLVTVQYSDGSIGWFGSTSGSAACGNNIWMSANDQNGIFDPPPTVGWQSGFSDSDRSPVYDPMAMGRTLVGCTDWRDG